MNNNYIYYYKDKHSISAGEENDFSENDIFFSNNTHTVGELKDLTLHRAIEVKLP